MCIKLINSCSRFKDLVAKAKQLDDDKEEEDMGTILLKEAIEKLIDLKNIKLKGLGSLSLSLGFEWWKYSLVELSLHLNIKYLFYYQIIKYVINI